MQSRERHSGWGPEPGFGSFTIARERLVTAAIGEEAAQVLVRVPAGAGKTTLLSQLAVPLHDRGDAVCWLRLAAEDNDAWHLLRGILSAVGEGLLRAGSGAADPKTHVRSIYDKLGVHSRRQAVARANELGLI